MPSDYKAREQLSRARRSGLLANLTQEQWASTLQYFKRKCAYCLENSYEVVEHFIPMKLGGGTTYANCVPACSSCNTCKDHPKFILLGDREEARRALLRVAAYLQNTGEEDYSQATVDAYIAAQYQKVPKHHNTQS